MKQVKRTTWMKMVQYYDTDVYPTKQATQRNARIIIGRSLRAKVEVTKIKDEIVEAEIVAKKVVEVKEGE